MAVKIDETAMSNQELITLLQAMLVDITAQKTAIAAVTAKLDADATVTDTNYAATCNSGALTVTAS